MSSCCRVIVLSYSHPVPLPQSKLLEKISTFALSLTHLYVMFWRSLEFSTKFIFTSGAKPFHFRRKKRKERCRNIWAVVNLVTWHWCAKNLKHSVFYTSYIKLGVHEREVIARKYYRFGSLRWIAFKDLSRWQWSMTTSVGNRLLLKTQAKHSSTPRQASLKNMPTINDSLYMLGTVLGPSLSSPYQLPSKVDSADK